MRESGRHELQHQQSRGDFHVISTIITTTTPATITTIATTTTSEGGTYHLIVNFHSQPGNHTISSKWTRTHNELSYDLASSVL
jgi:hypothetical protein